MAGTEDSIRRLIASGKIRVDGMNVYADPDISPGLRASREENAAHIDMLRRAYHMYPRQDSNMPMPDPYIAMPDYIAGGSENRLQEQEAFLEQWAREMEDIRRAGFSPSRAMRSLRDPEMRPGGRSFENLPAETYSKALGLGKPDVRRR